MRTWRSFVKAFRSRFIGEYDEEDIMEDLRPRTQAKGESIASFLSIHRYIIRHLKKPLNERRQMKISYRNLLPEYRRAISDKVINSLDDIERYSKRWERQKELDQPYIPPAPADKMRVPEGAYYGANVKVRAAAVVQDSEAPAATAATSADVGKKSKARWKHRAKGEQESASEAGDVTAEKY